MLVTEMCLLRVARMWWWWKGEREGVGRMSMLAFGKSRQTFFARFAGRRARPRKVVVGCRSPTSLLADSITLHTCTCVCVFGSGHYIEER